MATGDTIKIGNATKGICLLASTAAQAAPTLATDGVPAYPANAVFSVSTGAMHTGLSERESTLCVKVGGTTPSAILTMWGYVADDTSGTPGFWVPIVVNTGTAVTVNYSQRMFNCGHFQRLALSLGTVTGTSPTFEAWLMTGSEDR